MPIVDRLTRIRGYLAPRLFTDETLVVLRWGAPEHPEPPDLRIRRAGAADLSHVLAFDSPRHLAAFRAFLAAGDRGYLAHLRGRCVHRVFVTPGPARVQLHRFWSLTLGPQEVFVHSARTAGDARGLGVAPAVVEHFVHELGEDRDYLTLIDARNEPALRAARSSGFVERERVRLVVVGGLMVRRATPVSAAGRVKTRISRVHLRPGRSAASRTDRE